VSGTDAARAEDEAAAVRFVYEEARLLDERRFEEWLELFDLQGVYWVPSQPGQVSARDTLSLVHEHRSLLAVRVARLRQAGMHSQNPPVRTHHHVSAVVVRAAQAADFDLEVDASLILCEWRHDEGRWFAGRTHHRLRRDGSGLRIVLKRVDLINCDSPHRALTVPL
jgi:3-phenylpropionate/cinnamic acid dioxygenase small subunit